MLDFLRGERRLPGDDDDHRVGPRHPHRQHADRRARRPARPRPGLPDPRPGRALPRARLRLPALPLGRGADRGGGGPPRDPRRPHRARLGLPDRDARPRHPRRRQPARRRAVRPRRRGRLRALLPDDRRGGRRGRRAPTAAAEEAPEPVRLDVPVDAYLPAAYVPFEAAKIDVHRRIAAAREPRRAAGDPRRAERPLRPAAAARPRTCWSCSGRGSSWAWPGARSVEFRGGRLSVTGVELDSEQAGALREQRRGGALRVAGADRRGARPRRARGPAGRRARDGRRPARGEARRRAPPRICSPPRESRVEEEAHDGQGRRRSAAKRPAGPAPLRASACWSSASSCVVLFVGFAIAEGLGDPSVPSAATSPWSRTPPPATSATSPRRSSTARPGADRRPGRAEEACPSRASKQYDDTEGRGDRRPARHDLDPGRGGRDGDHGDATRRSPTSWRRSRSRTSKPRPSTRDSSSSSALHPGRTSTSGSSCRCSAPRSRSRSPKKRRRCRAARSRTTTRRRRSQFTHPETRDVRLVLNKDKAKVEQAKAALEKDDSAQSWKKVAKQYSTDPARRTTAACSQG